MPNEYQHEKFLTRNVYQDDSPGGEYRFEGLETRFDRALIPAVVEICYPAAAAGPIEVGYERESTGKRHPILTFDCGLAGEVIRMILPWYVLTGDRRQFPNRPGTAIQRKVSGPRENALDHHEDHDIFYVDDQSGGAYQLRVYFPDQDEPGKNQPAGHGGGCDFYVDGLPVDCKVSGTPTGPVPDPPKDPEVVVCCDDTTGDGKPDTKYVSVLVFDTATGEFVPQIRDLQGAPYVPINPVNCAPAVQDWELVKSSLCDLQKGGASIPFESWTGVDADGAVTFGPLNMKDGLPYTPTGVPGTCPAAVKLVHVETRRFCSDQLPPFVRVSGTDSDPDAATFTHGTGNGDFESSVGYFENDEATPYACATGTKIWTFTDGAGYEYSAEFNFADNPATATPLNDLGARPWAEIASWLNVSGSGTASETVVLLKQPWWWSLENPDTLGVELIFSVSLVGNCGTAATGESNTGGVLMGCKSRANLDDQFSCSVSGVTLTLDVGGVAGLTGIACSDLPFVSGWSRAWGPGGKVWRLREFTRADTSVQSVVGNPSFNVSTIGGWVAFLNNLLAATGASDAVITSNAEVSYYDSIGVSHAGSYANLGLYDCGNEPVSMIWEYEGDPARFATVVHRNSYF